jgi:mono/diheme cytochrome c family protein
LNGVASAFRRAARYIEARVKEVRMLKTTRVWVPFTAVVALAALAVPAAAQDAKAGEKVYAAQKCAVCHAIAGKGGKASPLDGIGAKLSADEIRHWIVDPLDAAAKAKSTKKPPMQAKYKSLPAGDIDALVAYVQSLK